MRNFIQWLKETKHSIDPSGFTPAAWENLRVEKNSDGKTGKIGPPIGDENKGATKYQINYDDGTTEVLSISAIKKQLTFERPEK